ncbi:hypothetical protein HZP52_00640 [Elizabethkingia anophelis]|nr:hypothetical protein [Elizabethkingia anophelis]
MILTEEQCNDLKRIVSESITRLYTKDPTLIKRKGMEQSAAFRFALYLNKAFLTLNSIDKRELHLDIEYNKNGLIPKRTPRRPNGTRPDLIIHKRDSNEFNLLIVEIKGAWNKQPREKDIIKLQDFTHQEGEYKYGLGVFLELNPNNCTPVYYRGY